MGGSLQYRWTLEDMRVQSETMKHIVGMPEAN
jgi:hypothetical protein